MAPLESKEWHDARYGDAVALANGIVLAGLDGRPEVAQRLIGSIITELTRDLPDDGSVWEIVDILARRVERVVVVVDVMAGMVVSVIEGAQRAGIEVHLEKLASPYTELAGLDEDPE